MTVASAADVVMQALHDVLGRRDEVAVALRNADADAVHDTRVALRTVRSNLQTFGALFETAWSRSVLDEVELLGGTLGPVRDTHVVGSLLGDLVRGLDAPERAAARPLVNGLALDEQRATVTMLAAMLDPAYDRLDAALTGALGAPQLTHLAREAAAVVLPPMVRHTWRRLRHGAARGGSPAAMHHTRIRAKAMRYALETVAPVAGQHATAMATEVRHLQDLLGRQHDCIVLAARLGVLAEDCVDTRVAFSAGVLSATARAESDAVAARWPKAWKRVRRGSHSWLRGPW